MNELKDALQRTLNARDRFKAFVVEQIACTPDEADHILRVYEKARAVKFNIHDGQFHLVHGALAEASVLQNALSI